MTCSRKQCRAVYIRLRNTEEQIRLKFVMRLLEASMGDLSFAKKLGSEQAESLSETSTVRLSINKTINCGVLAHFAFEQTCVKETLEWFVVSNVGDNL